MSFFSRFFCLHGFVIKRRLLLVIVTLIAGFTVMAGIPNLTLDTDGRVFMDDNNP